MRRQEFVLQLESEFGSLHETTISMSCKSERGMPMPEHRSQLATSMRDYYRDANGIKLVGLAVNESILIDILLP